MSLNTGRTKLGSWTFPSGNSCDVTYARDVNGVQHVFFAWDFPPPLGPDDAAYYQGVVVPEIIRYGLRME